MKTGIERFIPGDHSKRMEQDHIARYEFASHYVQNLRVLDIACGVGYGTAILANAGAKHVDGVDISDDAINYANKQYKRSNTQFHVADIVDYRSSVAYDLITCFETIEHITYYHSAIGNLSSLLSTSGILIISSPNRQVVSPNNLFLTDKPVNPYHTQEFTIKELQKILVANNFNVESNHIFGQRYQMYHKNVYLTRILRRFSNLFQDSNIYPSTGRLQPRYIVMIGRK